MSMQETRTGTDSSGRERTQCRSAESYVVGDKWSDINAGKNAGCQTIFVLTGHGTDELLKMKNDNCPIAADLYEAVNTYIIGKNNSPDNDNL